MTDDDQPRPDLDAAMDAVLPTLSAVSGDEIAASLRRTRIALADATAQRDPAGAWGWAIPVAAAAAIVLAALSMAWWWPAHMPAIASVPDAPVASPASRVTPPPADRPPGRVDSRPVAAAAAQPPRVARVRASSRSNARVATARRDPLLALMDAVQAIPDDAWDRGVALAEAPVPVPRVSVEPIAIAPLETPPIVDAPVECIAPGEP